MNLYRTARRGLDGMGIMISSPIDVTAGVPEMNIPGYTSPTGTTVDWMNLTSPTTSTPTTSTPTTSTPTTSTPSPTPSNPTPQPAIPTPNSGAPVQTMRPSLPLQAATASGSRNLPSAYRETPATFIMPSSDSINSGSNSQASVTARGAVTDKEAAIKRLMLAFSIMKIAGGLFA